MMNKLYTLFLLAIFVTSSYASDTCTCLFQPNQSGYEAVNLEFSKQGKSVELKQLLAEKLGLSSNETTNIITAGEEIKDDESHICNLTKCSEAQLAYIRYSVIDSTSTTTTTTKSNQNKKFGIHWGL
jgi:hypothetical protein